LGERVIIKTPVAIIIAGGLIAAAILLVVPQFNSNDANGSQYGVTVAECKGLPGVWFADTERGVCLELTGTGEFPLN
jgi:hypothetical protein